MNGGGEAIRTSKTVWDILFYISIFQNIKLLLMNKCMAPVIKFSKIYLKVFIYL